MFYRTELSIIYTTFALLLATAVLAVSKSMTVNLNSFMLGLMVTGIFVTFGLFYRRFRPDERISSTLIAIGIFLTFSTSTVIFNHALLPLGRPTIDPLLIELDALLGYSWPAVMEWVSNYPQLAYFWHVLYQMTLLFMLLAMLYLGIANNREQLHKLLVATMIAALSTIFCWVIFPSAGASSVWVLDKEIEAIVLPIVDSADGQKINTLIAHGIDSIDHINLTGLIGFPSFHTVMVLLPCIYIAHRRYARVAFFAVGAATLPSIATHGGHNLLDIFGGMAITAMSVYATKILYERYLGVGQLAVFDKGASEPTAAAA